MSKQLSIAHQTYSYYYAILRRRSTGYIFNNTSGAAETLGTWNDARKSACAVALADQGADYHEADLPAGCDEGIWDVFYFGNNSGAGNEQISDRLVSVGRVLHGSFLASESSMFAIGRASAGETNYIIMRLVTDGTVWNNTTEQLEALGTWNNSRKAACARGLDDKGGGYYTKSFPSACTTVGTYRVFYYEQAGGSIDITDRIIGRSEIAWYSSGGEAELAATGERGLAMLYLRDLVAASSSFQTAVGAGDADAAKAHIHITAYTPSVGGNFTRPFAMISRTESDTRTTHAERGSVIGGDLELRFEQDIPADYKNQPGNAEIYFLNWVEAVLAEMRALAGTSGYLAVNKIDTIEGPTQIQSDSTDAWVNGIRLLVNWGLTE